MLNTDLLKFKRQIRELLQYKGSNTSMITIYMRPDYAISLVAKDITDEKGKAENIKDRVNGNSVKQALTVAEEKIRGLFKSPKNGYVLFAGTVLMDDGRTRTISKLIEPPKPVFNLYRCDKEFYITPLLDMVESTIKYGVAVIDGSGYLLGDISGSERTIYFKKLVDLPKKHNKGGQSSVRFARLREEARHKYAVSIAERINMTYLNSDGTANVAKIFLCGSAEIKQVILGMPDIDYRLKPLLHNELIDIAYGGEKGFDEAFTKLKPMLSGLELMKEHTIIEEWLNDIASGKDTIIYGKEQTMQAYRDGVLKTFMLWDENIDTIDTADGSKIPLIDYLLEKKDVELVIVSNKTSVGNQFIMGFSGYGGYLRYSGLSYNETVYDEADRTLIEDEFI